MKFKIHLPTVQKIIAKKFCSNKVKKEFEKVEENLV